MQSLRTGERKTLVSDAHDVPYAGSGHLLFVRHNTLYAAALDLNHLELIGTPAPVVDDISNRVQSGAAVFDVASNGSFIYQQGQPDQHRLAWLDDTGRTQPLPARVARYEYGLRVSPAGNRLALSAPAASFDVWTYEWERDTLTRITFAPENDRFPVWSPDGTHIAYECVRETTTSICWVRADGAGEPLQLLTRPRASGVTPYSFSPDGKWLTLGERSPNTKTNLWALPLEDIGSDHPK